MTVKAPRVRYSSEVRDLQQPEMHAGYPSADRVIRGGAPMRFRYGLSEDELDRIRAAFRVFSQIQATR